MKLFNSIDRVVSAQICWVDVYLTYTMINNKYDKQPKEDLKYMRMLGRFYANATLFYLRVSVE